MDKFSQYQDLNMHQFKKRLIMECERSKDLTYIGGNMVGYKGAYLFLVPSLYPIYPPTVIDHDDIEFEWIPAYTLETLGKTLEANNNHTH